MFSVNLRLSAKPKLGYGVADDMLRATSGGTDFKNMKVINQQELIQFICEFRQLTGLTQEQFAAFLGVTYPTINRWENGRTNPSPMAMKLIEQKLWEMGEGGNNLRERYFAKFSDVS